MQKHASALDSMHGITISIDNCGIDAVSCTLGHCFEDGNLNRNSQGLPTFADDDYKEIDLLLLDLCAIECSTALSSQPATIDFDPVKPLKLFPAPPPKKFGTCSRWFHFTKTISIRQRRRNVASFRSVDSENHDLPVDQI